jgi:hypothetical protein
MPPSVSGLIMTLKMISLKKRTRGPGISCSQPRAESGQGQGPGLGLRVPPDALSGRTLVHHHLHSQRHTTDDSQSIPGRSDRLDKHPIPSNTQANGPPLRIIILRLMLGGWLRSWDLSLIPAPAPPCARSPHHCHVPSCQVAVSLCHQQGGYVHGHCIASPVSLLTPH